jgi:ribosomal protein S18 acetylase RimI-like enzyme
MITFPRLGLSDASEIARVHFESWRATYRDVLPDSYIDGAMRDDIAKVWANWTAEKLVVGATVNGALVGIATYDMGMDQAVPAYLDNFHVLPDHHGTGLASELFVAGVDAIASEGACALWLTVLDTNARARAFYAKMYGQEGVPKDDEMLGYAVRAVPVHWTDLQLIQKNHA